ncbi:MAG: hypothetical protein P8H93_02595 [Polaribacter sp.]|nr:hypothetical protein [Polaribacter sp.]
MTKLQQSVFLRSLKAFYPGKQGISTVIIEKETLPRYKTYGGVLVNRGRRNIPFEISEVIERKFFTVDGYLNNSKLKFQ